MAFAMPGFTNPNLLWLLVAAALFWWLANRRIQMLIHPQAEIHRQTEGLSWLGRIHRSSQALLWTSLVLALCGPMLARVVPILEHSAVVFVSHDTSDSMQWGLKDTAEIQLIKPDYKEPVKNANGYIMDQQKPVKATRAQAAAAALRIFMAHTHGNRIGLICFDDIIQYVYPPTDNYKVLLDNLPDVEAYINSGPHGTNFDGPSVTDRRVGALQGAVNLFHDLDPSLVRVYIMVTDGDSKIDPKRAQELAAAYKKYGIHLFVFGVGDDWLNDGKDIQSLKQFVKSVDGTVVPLGDKQQFDVAVSQIDELTTPSMFKRTLVLYEQSYLLFLIAAAVFFVIYLVSSALTREAL